MATSLEDRPGRQVTETLLDAVISVEAPHDVRLTAAWSLRDRPDRAITDALLATLHDCTDPQTRWYLLRALATRPGQDVTDALLHALTSGEEDSHARRVQALELRDRPEPKVTAALREALKDPDMRSDAAPPGRSPTGSSPPSPMPCSRRSTTTSPTSGNPPSRRYPVARIRASPPNSSTH
jgi:HEAT repeat protein